MALLAGNPVLLGALSTSKSLPHRATYYFRTNMTQMVIWLRFWTTIHVEKIWFLPLAASVKPLASPQDACNASKWLVSGRAGFQSPLLCHDVLRPGCFMAVLHVDEHDVTHRCALR